MVEVALAPVGRPQPPAGQRARGARHPRFVDAAARPIDIRARHALEGEHNVEAPTVEGVHPRREGAARDRQGQPWRVDPRVAVRRSTHHCYRVAAGAQAAGEQLGLPP